MTNKPTCSSHFPGGSHELNKVVIIVDWGGNGGVVVAPFGHGDLSIIVFVAEVGKEFEVSFILSNLSRSNFWMSVAWVDNSQVTCSYNTRSIKIEFAECGGDNGLSGFVQLPSNGNEELVVVDGTIVIGIEMSEKGIGFFFGKVASTLIETMEEFLSVKLSVSIIITIVEHSTETSDGLSTSWGHLFLDL
jgi:hypothetical protein